MILSRELKQKTVDFVLNSFLDDSLKLELAVEVLLELLVLRTVDISYSKFTTLHFFTLVAGGKTGLM